MIGPPKLTGTKSKVSLHKRILKIRLLYKTSLIWLAFLPKKIHCLGSAYIRRPSGFRSSGKKFSLTVKVSLSDEEGW